MSDVWRKSLAGPYRLRTLLVAFVLAMTVPLAVLSVVLFFRQLAVDRVETESQLLKRAKILADEVDLELAEATVVLELLAASPLLQTDNLAGFSEQAARARDVIAANIVLRDMSGQQLVNTRIPDGQALPRNPIFEVDRRALETRQPAVSNLVTAGLAISDAIVIIVVPVFHGGEPRYLLAVTFRTDRLQALVTPERLGDGWIASIVDRGGLHLARTRDPTTAVGTPILANVWSDIGDAPDGIRRYDSRVGGTLLLGFTRSTASGWVVVAAVRDDWNVAGWRQSTLIMGAAFGLLFVLGLTLALWGGRRFSEDVEQIKRRAEALGTGDVLGVASKENVQEMEAISQAVKKASELISQRTAALAQAQKMEAVGQLTSGIAHDFNNVLGVVVSNLDLLLEEVQADSAANGFAEAALNTAMKGADLVQRLLAFSRKQTLELKPIDLGTMLEQIMPLVKRTIGDHIVKELKVAPGIWPVVADAIQLESCVLNLAINARDAMPDGGRLTIDCRNVTVDEHIAKLYPDLALGDYVVVSVTDTGTGIAPENIEKVFEPFFTTKEIGAGSGLGLSMVYGVMRQSGGTVKIYSEVGNGTTVSLYLPKPAHIEATESPKVEQAAEMQRGGERILVVEDNPEMRHVAIAGLESLGYKTVAAESGDAALALLESGERFDLVFTDIMMPGKLTGVDLAREARARDLAQKFIFTSGFASPLNMQDAARSSENLAMLWRKPYRKAILADTIRKVLDDKISRS